MTRDGADFIALRSSEVNGAFGLMRDKIGRVRGFAETSKKKHRAWRLHKGELDEQ